MANIQTLTENKKNKFLWTLPYVVVAAGLLFTFIGLSEFYNIKIAGKQAAYPFEPINNNPWYYQTASTYATYNLTSGILFLIASLVTVWATIRKSRMLLILGTTMIIILFIAELINGNVQ